MLPKHNHHHHHPHQTRSSRRLATYFALLGVPCVLLAWTWRINLWGIALLESQQNQQQEQQQHNPPPLHPLQHVEPTITKKRRKEEEEEKEAVSPVKQPVMERLQQQPQKQQENQRIETETLVKKEVISSSSTVSPPKFHFVFSTGCSIFQDWQSYVFFYHVLASRQDNAHVTRIASGCKDDEAAILRKQHEDEIASTMSRNFFLHLTPDYSKIVPGDNYKFFNKPFGLRHWMETALGYHPNSPSEKNENDDMVIVIFDPDQFLIRPFVQDFTNEPELWTKRLRTNTTTGAESSRQVERGRPMGARYAFGGNWIHQVKISEILNSTTAPSPVRNWTVDYVDDYFSVGPPYMAVSSDMYRLVQTWSDFVVPIYHQTDKGFMAEMYAYSTAAVHLNLPHTTSRSFMISDPTSGIWNEGWEWFDHLTSTEVCSARGRDIALLPHVLHYCQRYFLGPYFFSKYQLPKGSRDNQFLSCSHGLFHEPPPNVGDLYNSSVTLDWTFNELNPTLRLRMAFLLCQILPRLNDAATFYKDHHCLSSSSSAAAGAAVAAGKDDISTVANYSKTFFFSKHPKKG
jgi:peptidyl serine alpha-galactosyltransferase